MKGNNENQILDHCLLLCSALMYVHAQMAFQNGIFQYKSVELRCSLSGFVSFCVCRSQEINQPNVLSDTQTHLPAFSL